MSGRHRRTNVAAARRALAGTVPVLGLAGLVTATVGTAPDSAPEAVGTALVTTPVPTPGSVGLDQQDLGIGPDITTVASDASKAAGQAGQQQRAQEQRSIDLIVADVRDDARARDAAADQQGDQRLDAFQRDVQQLRKADEEKSRKQDREQARQRSDDNGDSGGSCMFSGFPGTGGSADSDEIVGRDCGLVDLFGMQRSSDPWIDGQLLSARDDD